MFKFLQPHFCTFFCVCVLLYGLTTVMLFDCERLYGNEEGVAAAAVELVFWRSAKESRSSGCCCCPNTFLLSLYSATTLKILCIVPLSTRLFHSFWRSPATKTKTFFSMNIFNSLPLSLSHSLSLLSLSLSIYLSQSIVKWRLKVNQVRTLVHFN